MKRILVAGGSGFIGSLLIKKLKDKNHQPVILSRNPKIKSEFATCYWNVSNGEIQVDALKNIDVVINLAGENVSAGRWTKKQKQKIIDSRVNSSGILFNAIKNSELKPQAYISSSATGFYGISNPDKIFTETDPHGNDFLALVCKDWEDAAHQFGTMGIRTCILRTGVVFGKDSGAFPKLTQTLRFGFVSALGSGKQYMPWIHADDLTEMYCHAIDRMEMNGIFNAVAPQHISQQELIDKIRKLTGSWLKTPNVPAFVLKTLFGEMASILLSGSRVSAEKILLTGFKIKFPEIDLALKSLLNKTASS